MTNIGETDQVVRAGVASVLLILAVGLQGYAWWLMAPAAVLYVTASMRYCPLYVPFHINTHSATQEHH